MPASTGTGNTARLTSEQLRTKALLAASAIASGAAVEYEHYTRLRDNLRTESGRPRPAPVHESSPRSTGPRNIGELAAQLSSEDGAGLFPVLTVLAPILVSAAGLVFLLLGYVLSTASPSWCWAARCSPRAGSRWPSAPARWSSASSDSS